jgi:hypothetical protein
MTERKLKLIKVKNAGAKHGSRVAKKRKPASRPSPDIQNPAEAAEAARFRALTVARATQQAMIRRIMAELLEVDQAPPAA